MNKIKNWATALKKRWGIQHNWEILVILLVFSCTGFTVMYFKKWFFTITGIAELARHWRFLFWILLILPAYQVILLAYGFLFGKYKFFLAFVKKMFGKK